MKSAEPEANLRLAHSAIVAVSAIKYNWIDINVEINEKDEKWEMIKLMLYDMRVSM